MKTFNIWFDKVFSKLNVLVVSLVYSLGVYFFIIKDAPAGCDAGWCTTPLSDITMPLIFPLAVVIVSTLVMYFLPRKVFSFWIKFALIWTVVAYVWVALTPHYSPPSFFFSFDQKPGQAITQDVWFAMASLLIMIVYPLYLRFSKVKK